MDFEEDILQDVLGRTVLRGLEPRWIHLAVALVPVSLLWAFADGVLHGSEKSFDLMELGPDESPVGIQLFGSDPAKMAESLRRLSEVPDSTILFPGHRYSIASSATMDVLKETNLVFQ